MDVDVIEQTIAVAEETTTHAAVQRVVTRPIFKCPAHKCWTCSGGSPPHLSNKINTVSKNTKKRKKRNAKSSTVYGEKKDNIFVSGPVASTFLVILQEVY